MLKVGFSAVSCKLERRKPRIFSPRKFIEGLRKVGEYLIAADIYHKHQEAEDRIKFEKTGRADILPFEAGFKTGAKIYLLRLRNWPVESATLMSRWTGIDLVIRGSRRLLGRDKPFT